MDKKENAHKNSQYGDFVPTYFEWLLPEEQKKRAEEIDKMTKKKK